MGSNTLVLRFEKEAKIGSSLSDLLGSMKIVFAKFFYCWFISDAHCSKLIHFIVDSRSDIETSSESWKAELQLAYLHNVESRGAHSAADRPLFKGVIKLGVKKISVEVVDCLAHPISGHRGLDPLLTCLLSSA